MSAEVAQPPNGESALLSKLQSYTLVTSAVDLYQNLKQSSALATASLDLCETVARRGIEVSIPVIKKVDEYTHIDERSVMLLDAVEARAAQAKEGMAAVNEFAQHPLDSVIDALDAYLPLPENQNESNVKYAVSPKEDKEQLTSVGKIGAIGAHLGQAGIVKLRELQLRGPVHKAVAAQMWDLINYSAATLHLEQMGDRTAARIADAQHLLFAQAANAASNMQAFIEKSPILYAVEQTIQPYALTTKSYVEATAVRLLSALYAGSELTSHFFANRAADLRDLSTRSAQYATEWLDQFRKNHPEWEARLSQLLSNFRDTFARATALLLQIAAVPMDQLHTAFSAIYQVLNQLQETVARFRINLVASAKQHELQRQQQQQPLLLDVDDVGLGPAPEKEDLQQLHDEQQHLQQQQFEQQPQHTHHHQGGKKKGKKHH